MKNLSNILTIIPAKASSIRINKKNMTLLSNKPLIKYTIDVAMKSGACGEIMVSTEDEEIAAYATKLGVNVPFLRPSYLSHDPYEADDVCLNVLEEYSKIGKNFDTLIILLATSPLRNIQDIKNSIRLYQENNGNFLMSVSKMDPHYYNALTFKDDNITLSKIFNDSADKTAPVRCNGAVTIVDIKAFKKAGTYYGEPLIGYEMPWERSVDIDTEQDLLFAEWLINNKHIET